MKILNLVYYNEGNQFLLKDDEFKKAMTAWSKGNMFFCKRTGVLLTPYFKFTEPYVDLEKKVMENPPVKLLRE